MVTKELGRFSGPRKLLHLWLLNRQTEGLSQMDKPSTVPLWRRIRRRDPTRTPALSALPPKKLDGGQETKIPNMQVDQEDYFF